MSRNDLTYATNSADKETVNGKVNIAYLGEYCSEIRQRVLYEFERLTTAQLLCMLLGSTYDDVTEAE